MKKQQKELDAKIIGDDLCKLADILVTAGICNDTGPLSRAGILCSKNSTSHEWRYKFDYLEFDIASQAGVIPSDCENLKLRFSIDIVGILQDESTVILNPLKTLKFDIELMGSGWDYKNADILPLHSSWHLDKHLREKDDGKPKYSHPEYHFAYGGNKMENQADIYGSSLILPAPRFSYPPMDAALGINFILQNYFHKNQIESIVSDPIYRSIIYNSQNILFRPYFQSLISSWFDTGLKFENYLDVDSVFPLLMKL